MKKFILFLILFISLQSSVNALSYFDTVLSGVSSLKILKPFQEITSFWDFGKLNSSGLLQPVDLDKLEERISVDRNIFMVDEKNYFDEDMNNNEVTDTKKEVEAETGQMEKEEKKAAEETYLSKVLERLGLLRPGTNVVASTATSTSFGQGSVSQDLPIINPQVFPYQQPNSLNQLLNGNSYGNLPVSNRNPNLMGPAAPQMLATPYSGPGGAIPGECGIPKGPWAYNIGGNSVSCDARVIVKPFRSQDITGISKDKVWLAGYVNPAVQKDLRSKFPSPNCGSSAGKYGEGCFSDYSSGAGQAYVQWQLLHWQEMGDKVGQKCVPIDIDNCDAIGTKNYLSILDQIEKFNNKSSKAKLLVLNKNPHNNCDFMSHAVVGGAFVEISEDPVGEVVNKVNAVRKKPEQILVFARGGTGSNEKVRAAQNSGIKNSAFSFDKGGEYERVDNCTYNP